MFAKSLVIATLAVTSAVAAPKAVPFGDIRAHDIAEPKGELKILTPKISYPPPTSPNVKRQGIGGPLGVNIYSDSNCQDQIDAVTIDQDTCYQRGSGFGSMSINANTMYGTWTAYTQDNCGCPTCGSHGYDAGQMGCAANFGFVANAIGYEVDT